jgi:hypothetical protein
MPPPKYKTFEIPQGGIVILGNKGKRGQIHDVGCRDDRHGGTLAVMADPSKGNKLNMKIVRNAVVTKTKIMHHAAAMTKGKAPIAMTRTIKIQLHVEQREAVAVAKISRKMSRARKGEIPPHPHQAAPMAVAAVVEVWLGPIALKKIHHSKGSMTCAPISMK